MWTPKRESGPGTRLVVGVAVVVVHCILHVGQPQAWLMMMMMIAITIARIQVEV